MGLAWLAEAKRETGLPFGVEVATERHVEAALAAGADMVWIGARTVGSPFGVQEAADALRGTGVSVLVKNPPMPDTELWTGAVERLLDAGLAPERLMLVHRGFAQKPDGGYRNPPMWHIALEMRRRFPQLRMLCDPSHICGRRARLAATAQKAADLSYDGLFMESHAHPDEALSDAAQQITPEELAAMVHGICWRTEQCDTPLFDREIEKLRLEIDQIDSQVLELLARRMSISDEIGRMKRDNGITIFQRARWKEVLANSVGRAAELGLSPKFLHAIMEAVHMESIARQNRVMNGPDE